MSCDIMSYQCLSALNFKALLVGMKHLHLETTFHGGNGNPITQWLYILWINGRGVDSRWPLVKSSNYAGNLSEIWEDRIRKINQWNNSRLKCPLWSTTGIRSGRSVGGELPWGRRTWRPFLAILKRTLKKRSVIFFCLLHECLQKSAQQRSQLVMLLD